MKKVVLILLILVLPLQAFAAMERDLAHMLGGGGPGLEFILKPVSYTHLTLPTSDLV